MQRTFPNCKTKYDKSIKLVPDTKSNKRCNSIKQTWQWRCDVKVYAEILDVFFWFSAELLGEYIIINSTLTENRPVGKDRFYFNKLCFSIFIFKTSSKSFLFCLNGCKKRSEISGLSPTFLWFESQKQLFQNMNHWDMVMPSSTRAQINFPQKLQNQY